MGSTNAYNKHAKCQQNGEVNRRNASNAELRHYIYGALAGKCGG